MAMSDGDSDSQMQGVRVAPVPASGKRTKGADRLRLEEVRPTHKSSALRPSLPSHTLLKRPRDAYCLIDRDARTPVDH